MLLIVILLATSAPADPAREVRVDVRQTKGQLDRFFQFCVGSDHASVDMRAANQEQLALVRKELGFRYIRFHGIFHDDMGVYREKDGLPVYNFDRIDQLYDSFLHIGMKPFVELSFMPTDLASGKKLMFWWKGNVTPPKDYSKWGGLIEAFVRHLEDRYGKPEVESWFFEVWNEPNLAVFWAGNQADYFKLYDVTAAAIKKVDPLCRVGGPSTAGVGWIPEFIQHCLQGNQPLDFISTHTYAVKKFVDADGRTNNQLSGNVNSIASSVDQASREVSASKMPRLPIYFTEWSTSSSSRDPVHDDYLSASFILDKIKKSQGKLLAMSYWTYSDLFEETGPPPTPFHGGFGLLNREGIRKASFFAYKYLNELGDQELQDADAQSIACRDGRGVSILAWNHTLPHLDSSDQKYFVVKHPAAAIAPLTIRITNLPAGTYHLEIHRAGYQANDAYSAFIDMGRPRRLSAAQLAALQDASSDRAETDESVVVGSDGLFARTVSMRENDVVLVSVRR
jgi:xylan 1,4-beta-xylosidase